MDQRTLEFYESNAEALAESWESAGGPSACLSRLIRCTFAPGTRVVDVGCGSGRDLAGAVSERIDGWGIEPSEQLRRVAQERHPALNGRVVAGYLPDGLPPVSSIGGAFDGLLCIAALQHVPREKLLGSVLALKRLLATGARAIVSVPETGPILDAERRDEGGRLFSSVTGDELRMLFERIGFTLRDSFAEADGFGRADRTWRTLVFQLGGSDAARPLDLIAGVIENDRKSATYKLALLRALCEIARRESRHVDWPGDGRVLVPLDSVAERWLAYYWPLVADAHAEFVPQLQGDWKERKHHLGFAKSLGALAASWGASGPAAYLIARRSGELDGGRAELDAAVTRDLRRAIRTGPVTHAGLSTTGVPLFANAGQHLALRVDLWRELTLMGHWIEDAILIRWAEVSSRYTRGELPPSRVLDRLLAPLDPERDVRDARAAYGDLKPLRCAWTGALLGNHWHADHLLPFSIWRNNELWNLVPATKRANEAKSNRLPTRELLLARRDELRRCWEHVGVRMPRRFASEATAFTGSTTPSSDLIFDALVDAVETTAVQRGLLRWDG